MRWPDPQLGPWMLRLTFGIVGDRPGVVAVELYAVHPRDVRRGVAGWPFEIYEPGRRKGREPTAEDSSLFEVTGHEAITTSGMRIPLAELTASYLASAERSDRIVLGAAPSMAFSTDRRRAAAERLERLDTTTRRRGPGRPAAYGREHYEQVATVYLTAQREGRSPTKAVAEEMAGGYPEGKSAAGKWVSKCRELGLLPETVRGKAAGWPVAAPRGRGKGKQG